MREADGVGFVGGNGLPETADDTFAEFPGVDYGGVAQAGVEARKLEYSHRDWQRGGEAEEREHPGRYTGRAGWVRHAKKTEYGVEDEKTLKKRKSRSKSAMRECEATRKRSASASAT